MDRNQTEIDAAIELAERSIRQIEREIQNRGLIVSKEDDIDRLIWLAGQIRLSAGRIEKELKKRK